MPQPSTTPAVITQSYALHFYTVTDGQSGTASVHKVELQSPRVYVFSTLRKRGIGDIRAFVAGIRNSLPIFRSSKNRVRAAEQVPCGSLLEAEWQLVDERDGGGGADKQQQS